MKQCRFKDVCKDYENKSVVCNHECESIDYFNSFRILSNCPYAKKLSKLKKSKTVGCCMIGGIRKV